MKKIFTPLFTILLLIGAGSILATNLLPYPQSPFDMAKNKRDHLTLAQIFLQNNDYFQAKKEFTLTGINFISEPEKITAEINTWEKFILKYPNYRDGYIKLAILNWKIFNEEKTKYYLSLAREIDPNRPLPQLP